jgi:oxygen-independent coproporphyrinogen-3 oxidase
VQIPVADWPTKRAWVSYAFDRLQQAGYAVSSAYTLVKDPTQVNFSYRDNLWRGSDLLATGVASFGHISGVHYQNHPEWAGYVDSLLEDNRLPVYRALRPSPHQLLIREMILQLKRGYLDAQYFQKKFQVDILEHWQSDWQQYADANWLKMSDGRIELTREGLLRVDGLLPAFFEQQHRDVRYT